MLKSNLEILDYVHSCPNHTVDADTLAAFIGDSAERRLSDLFHDNLLARSSNWYSDGPVIYSLSGKGFDLLAQNEQERQRRADDEARNERHRLEANPRPPEIVVTCLSAPSSAPSLALSPRWC